MDAVARAAGSGEDDSFAGSRRTRRGGGDDEADAGDRGCERGVELDLVYPYPDRSLAADPAKDAERHRESFAELEAAGVTWVVVSGFDARPCGDHRVHRGVRVDLPAVAVRIVARCQRFGSVCSVPRRSRRPRSCGPHAPSTTPRSSRSRRGIRIERRRSRRSIASPRCTTAMRRCSKTRTSMPIYNPLPNGLHGRWTIAALEAGKHVLCEKPFTANAAEAEEVAAVARRTGLVVMEAFHYRYHPLAIRLVSLLRSGELGPDPPHRSVDVHAAVARWRHPLAARPGRRLDDGPRLLHDPPDAIARRRRARGRVGRGSRTIGRRRSMAARRHAPARWRDGSHHRRDAVAPAPGARCTSDAASAARSACSIRMRRTPSIEWSCADRTVAGRNASLARRRTSSSCARSSVRCCAASRS